MNEALRTIDLPTEAIALIKAGNPRVKASECVLTTSDENGPRIAPEGAVITAEQSENPDNKVCRIPVEPESVATRGTARPQTLTTKLIHKTSPMPRPPATFISMTVRVPGEIPTRLLRAATDCRISQQRPWTQQEIVAEALEQWLKINQY